jgi:hypothetical protein
MATRKEGEEHGREPEPLPRSEALHRLVEEARSDPAFFHNLVFEPEKTLSKLSYLGRHEKGAIVAISPEDVIAGLTGLITGPHGEAAICDFSCEPSCDDTCGAGSCFGTCMSHSCGHTCGARSCDITVEIAGSFEEAPMIARRRRLYRPIRRD